MLERIDNTWWQSKFLNIRDLGYIRVGAKTKHYSVTRRGNNALLGYIKWYSNWRQYCFFSLDCVFEQDCLRDIAQFVEEITADYWKNKMKNQYDVKHGYYKRPIAVQEKE